MEFGFLVKPYMENFQQNQCNKINNNSNKNNNLVDDDEGTDENGLVTPTSGESKIPATLKCPPAPKKPKTAVSPAKRKALLGQRILLDLSKEIESLFPPELLADLGNKIKKVRQLS